MRVFAGLPLGADLKKNISPWLADAGNIYKTLKFVDPALLHITLYFFGEIGEQEVDILKSTVSSFESKQAEAAPGKIFCFPSFKNPNVFYLSLNEGGKDVYKIYENFINRIKTEGYKPPGKRFVPHITIARRKKNRIDEDWTFLAKADFGNEKTVFNRLVLFQSVLKPEGPEYIPLSEKKLNM